MALAGGLGPAMPYIKKALETAAQGREAEDTTLAGALEGSQTLEQVGPPSAPVPVPLPGPIPSNPTGRFADVPGMQPMQNRFTRSEPPTLADFGVESGSIYSDLPSRDLWLRDRVAGAVREQSNGDGWFSRERLHLSNDQAQAQVESVAVDAETQKRLTAFMDAGAVRPELLKPEDLVKSWDNLEALLAEWPTMPKEPPLEMPNVLQGLLALTFAVVDPEHAIDYAVQPWQFQIAERDRAFQRDQAEYARKLEIFKVRFGIEEGRAQQIAALSVQNNNLLQQRAEADITRQWQAIANDEQSRQDWARTIFNFRGQLLQMDRQRQDAMASAAMDVLLSGRPTSPEIRAQAALILEGVWGVKIEPGTELNNAEKIQLEQIKASQFANTFTERTIDFRVNEAQAGSEAAGFQRDILRVQAENAPATAQTQLAMMKEQLKNLEIANQYLPEEKRLQLDALKAQIASEETRTRAGNWQLSTAQSGYSPEQRAAMQEAITKAEEKLDGLRQEQATNRQRIIDSRIKAETWTVGERPEMPPMWKAGDLPADYPGSAIWEGIKGLFGAGQQRLTEAQAEERNAKLREEHEKAVAAWEEKAEALVRTDSGYSERQRQIEQLEGELQGMNLSLTAVPVQGDGSGGGTNLVAGGDLGAKYQAQGLRYSMERRGEAAFTDCSEFTQCVYKDVGLKIPGTAGEQYDAVQAAGTLRQGAPQVGDLVFFKDSRVEAARRDRSAHHVGIIIGFGNDGSPIMRHASSAADKIVDVSLNTYLRTVPRMGLLGFGYWRQS